MSTTEQVSMSNNEHSDKDTQLQLTYWKQQLANAPTLELPTDRPRLRQQAYNDAQLNFTFAHELIDALKVLNRNTDTTLYMTLAAAFKIVLQRYASQDDISIGSTIYDQTYRNVPQSGNLFVNTLILRTDLSGNPTFLELLKRVSKTVINANTHANVPFADLTKALNIEHGTLQILIALEPSQVVQTFDQTDIGINSAQFDIALKLNSRTDGFAIQLAYNADLWNPETIQRMVDHWRTILEAVVVDPTQHIADISMLTDVEREQLLVTWNETSITYPEDGCLHQLVEQQVERTPDAVAIFFEEQQITYQELNQRSNQLAYHLDKLGVGPDVLVGVCMERSVELVIAILAVLKAGGAYVPLDPTYPQDRLAYMIADAQVPLVLTQTNVSQHIAATGVQMVYLDDHELFATGQHVNTLHKPVQLDNLAYLIYTSGSTGKPKGAMNTHRNINNQLLWRQNYPCRITAQDRILHKTTFSFDVSVWEFFWPLITGASIVVAIPEGHRDPAYLKAVMIEQAITTMHFVPAMLQVFLQQSDLQSCTHLRQVMSGGEALTPELQKYFFERFPEHVRLYNMYGPAEAAIDVTAWECQRASEQRNIPIGYPIANTQLYILDSRLQPVPIGMPGDLYIGGMSVARGYNRRPELTAERFIPNPFAATSGARLYATGDQARYRADGAIEYLGRVDSQIKLRGMRIELGEIEAALQQQPSIQQAITIIREDTPDNKQLVAYLLASGEQPTRETLREALKETLPDYMLPTAFVFLDAFPLTPSGKIDRRALPAPNMSQTTMQDNDDNNKPSVIMHYQLIHIWEELLATSPIGIKDNFFDLGGQSLLAARMIARIEQVFGKKISLSTLFAGPTIEALTHELMQQTQANAKTPLIPVQITSSGSKKPFFFLHGDWSGGAYYCFKLARKAGSDQPFYVIEPFIFPESQEIPTLEGQAAAHLKLVRSIQPEGPYYLGGYCNDGIIAYEMAQQLRAQGEQVEFLVMIDPPSKSLALNFAHLFNDILHLKERAQWKTYLYTRHIYIRKVRPLLLRISKRVDEQLMKSIQVSIEKDQAFTRLLPPLKTLRTDYGSNFAWAHLHYIRKPYPGKVTFIWSREELANEPDNSWNNPMQIKEADSHIISDTHYGILTDEIDAFAACLGTALQKAQDQNVDA